MTTINEKLFWSKVRKTSGCWEWQGCKTPKIKGYGRFMIGSRSDGTRKIDRAQRVAWLLIRGAIPHGLCVCHKCDNPPCVRPSHLFLGTKGDNASDMHRKGRGGYTGSPGVNHPLAKLQPKDVRKIKKIYAIGNISQASLGKQFNIGQMQVSRIVRGKRWNKGMGEL